MQIVWAPLAKADIGEVFQYISQDNPRAAEGVLTRILSSVEHLAVYPEIGRQGRLLGTKELVVPQTSYIVVYRVVGNVVQIASIIHSTRQWPENL